MSAAAWRRTAEGKLDWIAAAALAAPILLSYLPPGADFQQHFLEVAMMRGLGTPRFPLSLYAWNLGRPNQLFYFLGTALSFAVGNRWAAKLAFCVAIASWPLGAGRLGRHLGANPWSVVALAPLATGWAFFWGMAPLLLATGCLIGFLPDLDRLVREPLRPTRAAIVAAEVALLYSAHLAMVVVFGGAAVVLAVGRPWTWRENLGRFGPAALAMATMAIKLGFDGLPAVSGRESRMQFDGLGQRLREIPYALFGGHELTTIFAATLGLMLCVGLRFRARLLPGSLAGERSWRAWAEGHRFELLSAGCLLLYAVFPSQISAATYLHQRFLAPAVLIAGVSLGLGRPQDLLARGTSLAYLVAMGVATLPIYWSNQIELEDLARVTGGIAQPSAVLMVQLQRPSQGSVFSYVAGDAYAVAEKGGRALNSWADASTIGPIRIRSGREWPSPYLRLMRDPQALVPAVDFKHFRYALLHTISSADAELATSALQPEARLVARAGVWSLLESTLAVEPMDSPDYPLPSPSPESLRDRLARD